MDAHSDHIEKASSYRSVSQDTESDWRRRDQLTFQDTNDSFSMMVV